MAVLSPKRQVTLPKELCDRLGLAPGDDLDLVEHNGRIALIKRARGRSARVLKHLKADVRITEDESRDSAIAEADGGPRSARLSSPTIGAAPLGGPLSACRRSRRLPAGARPIRGQADGMKLSSCWCLRSNFRNV